MGWGVFLKKKNMKLISVILGNKRYKTPSTSFGLYVIYGKLVSWFFFQLFTTKQGLWLKYG